MYRKVCIIVNNKHSKEAKAIITSMTMASEKVKICTDYKILAQASSREHQTSGPTRYLMSISDVRPNWIFNVNNLRPILEDREVYVRWSRPQVSTRRPSKSKSASEPMPRH